MCLAVFCLFLIVGEKVLPFTYCVYAPTCADFEEVGTSHSAPERTQEQCHRWSFGVNATREALKDSVYQ